MFKTIHTSKKNKKVVTELTNKLGLGKENVIARLAIGVSLGSGVILDINNQKDSQGKEYSKNVLLGNYEMIYQALLSKHYGIHRNDVILVKYLKLHLDHGLELIKDSHSRSNNISGLEFLTQKIK